MNYSENQAWNPTFPFILVRGTNEYISASEYVKILLAPKEVLLEWEFIKRAVLYPTMNTAVQECF